MQAKALELTERPQLDGSVLYFLAVGIFDAAGTQVYTNSVQVATTTGTDPTPTADACKAGIAQVQQFYVDTQARAVALPTLDAVDFNS